MVFCFYNIDYIETMGEKSKVFKGLKIPTKGGHKHFFKKAPGYYLGVEILIV